jgi:hypothetical protein
MEILIMVPSETLNSMGFGNLGTTIAYLNSLESGVSDNKKEKANDGLKQLYRKINIII